MAKAAEKLSDDGLRFSSSPQEFAAAGKAIRTRVPRVAHGTWKPSPTRPDPLEILREADAQRMPDLVPIRYGRMLQSPFAFYRGTAGVMAADLAETPMTGITVQTCGDCHLKNFGGFATPERNIVFDINDFDETLPGPWEWDLKRLAASFVLAARNNSLSEEVAGESATICAQNYREAMREYSLLGPLELWYRRFGEKEYLEQVPDPKVRGRVQKRTPGTPSLGFVIFQAASSASEPVSSCAAVSCVSADSSVSPFFFFCLSLMRFGYHSARP